ncbi:MAG: ABC transporter substrate-binding protein [Alphaproteobacteria bacterium]
MSIQKLLRRGAAMGAIAVGLAAAAAGMAPVEAKTFKWANDGDIGSMDPHHRNETFSLGLLENVYEPLARRDKNLKLEPALATEWKQVSPLLWRILLRQNVKFHDGTPFSADDVVFSLARANSPGSNMTGYFTSVKEVRKIDANTVEIDTKVPDALLMEKFATIFIMSKAWSEKNNAQNSIDLTKKEENFATRNSNGTGPYMLKSREPDVQTILVKNPTWWDKPISNVDEVLFRRIPNDATRVAALLSGEIDMMYTVPPQDTERLSKTQGVKVLIKPETRVVYLIFDVAREELQYSSVKGKNPFKDKRVREAFYIAIDVETIKTRIMRNQSAPTALLVAPGLSGYIKEVDVRPKYDPERAKKLMTEAGFPNGFEITMNCPNDRYVNDEKICQAAAAMLARINVKVNLQAETRSKYFGKVMGPKYDANFMMLGWAPATYDVHNSFENLLQTRNAQTRKGFFNLGGWSNAEFDALSDQIATEIDLAKRNELIKKAHQIMLAEFPIIALHQQALVWATRANVEMEQPADNRIPYRFINMK